MIVTYCYCYNFVCHQKSVWFNAFSYWRSLFHYPPGFWIRKNKHLNILRKSTIINIQQWLDKVLFTALNKQMPSKYIHNALNHFQGDIIREIGWKKSDSFSKNEDPLLRNSKFCLILFNSVWKFGDEPNLKMGPVSDEILPLLLNLSLANWISCFLFAIAFELGDRTGLKINLHLIF